MVIRKNGGCTNCGKIGNNLVYVRVDFPSTTGRINHAFSVEFCSLECHRKFDWTKLQTWDDFVRHHLGKDANNPAYFDVYQQ